MSIAGERVELARYRLTTGERVLYGQRIDGTVAVADVPAGEHGRVYLVERHIESKDALDGLVAAYVADSQRRGTPAALCPASRALWTASSVPRSSARTRLGRRSPHGMAH
jgi:hypothetical protein